MNSQTVMERLLSLQPNSSNSKWPLSGVRAMWKHLRGREFHCAIKGYCRTQIFEFPNITFQTEIDDRHHEIYRSPSVQAYVASDLVDYFENSTRSNHYAINHSLRHQIDEIHEKARQQQEEKPPMFLVIEEHEQLTPVEMVRGECFELDEVVVVDGQKELMRVGGREGEQFLTACESDDGAWPELPNNQPLVNMILVGVRVGQQTALPIQKYLDSDCLVTDKEQFVSMMHPSVSIRPGGLVLSTPMDVSTYRHRVSEIRKAIIAMEQDMGVDHIKGLLNAMYRDEYRDDSYHRIQYLQLWQSFFEAAKKYLNYRGKSIKNDKNVVAGNKNLKELTDYRNKIAHGWMHTFDEGYLVNLQRTVNELIYRKYF